MIAFEFGLLVLILFFFALMDRYLAGCERL